MLTEGAARANGGGSDDRVTDVATPDVETISNETVNRSFGLVELAAAAIVMSAIVAFAPVSLSSWWVPRMTITLLTLPLGIWLLVRLVIGANRSAVIAIAYVLWAAFTSLLSTAPGVGILGVVDRPSSVLFMCSAAGAWAIGRNLNRQGRAALPWFVVGCAGVSALVALLQLFAQPTGLALGLHRGRPPGLAAFAPYFGAHAAASASFFAYRVYKYRSGMGLAGFVVSSFFVALSGSRVALLATVIVSAVAWARSRRATAGGLIPIVIVTSVAASVLSEVFGSGQSAVDRLGGEGIGDRLQVWSFGLRGWLEHPIQGWGVGQFRPATQAQFPDRWVERFPSDIDGVWRDAHNILVEHLVGVGIVGLALLIWFVVAEARRASGPCAWMCGAIALGWLVEAYGPQTYALAALLLGAASGPAARGRELGMNRRADWVAAAVGVSLATSFVLATASVSRPLESPRRDDLSGVEIWFRFDPRVDEAMAARNFNLVRHTGDDPSRVGLLWLQRAAEDEPGFTHWWTLVGLWSLRIDDLEGAAAAAARGLDLQPNHPLSMQIMEFVATESGDERLAVDLRERLCRVGIGDACDDR